MLKQGRIEIFKINMIGWDCVRSWVFSTEDKKHSAWPGHDWIIKHKPYVGGYYFCDEDGCESFIPIGGLTEELIQDRSNK